MPRRSAAQARQVKHETDRLVERIRAAIDSPDLAADSDHALLADLLDGFQALQSAEDELVVLTEALAESDAAIRAERERYQRLFEAAPDGYVVTDADGTVKEANGRARALLGAIGISIEGVRLDTFFEGEERDLVWSVLTDLAANVPVVGFEVALGDRDHPTTIEVQVDGPAPSRDESTDIRWLLRDITERLRLEREVQQLNADVELLTSFAEVSRLVTHTDDPTDTLLRGLVELATADQPGTRAAVLLTDERGTLTARAESDQVAAELCALELAHDGPVVEALGSGHQVVCLAPQLHAWPRLADHLGRHGLAWVVAQPIGDGGPLAGVFVVYGAGSPDAAQRTASLLADHAGATIANRELYMSTRRLAGHLETALHTRAVIEQAKGILMAREGCDPDRAFDVLRRASQRQNRKLHDIADELVARAPATSPDRAASTATPPPASLDPTPPGSAAPAAS